MFIIPSMAVTSGVLFYNVHPIAECYVLIMYSTGHDGQCHPSHHKPTVPFTVLTLYARHLCSRVTHHSAR